MDTDEIYEDEALINAAVAHSIRWRSLHIHTCRRIAGMTINTDTTRINGSSNPNPNRTRQTCFVEYMPNSEEELELLLMDIPHGDSFDREDIRRKFHPATKQYGEVKFFANIQIPLFENDTSGAIPTVYIDEQNNIVKSEMLYLALINRIPAKVDGHLLMRTKFNISPETPLRFIEAEDITQPVGIIKDETREYFIWDNGCVTGI